MAGQSKRQQQQVQDDSNPTQEDELIDLTQKLVLRSKRTERLLKRAKVKAKKPRTGIATIHDLPAELLLDILTWSRPSDVLALSQTCKWFQDFISHEEATIAKSIIRWRYPCLEKCFRLPKLIADIDTSLHPTIQDPQRQEIQQIHKKPYQHIKSPDPMVVCTCLTCLLRWNGLCLILDFAFWQANLDKGDPIPIIPRGRYPAWNQKLIEHNAATVSHALYHPLWYARILEKHLQSTVGSIRRHAQNKGNKRKRFRMTEEDAAAGTDLFLEAKGPVTFDFPYMRDNYYMLEAYLPSRSWISERGGWIYMPADHERDMQMLVRWQEWRKRKQLGDLKEVSQSKRRAG
ncbi:hypothetical protein BT63DRAFT_429212 [Microthyrium microscopicum]|uniref:F-box domain-containing protein n=1 Tax=Microthyrium microscopicum TaxID=703497 RepID=A0A6A6TWK2_9PEZI|nr:hypothetical protein BT63DRAFT_429212 [Microthyrium microscopicum]